MVPIRCSKESSGVSSLFCANAAPASNTTSESTLVPAKAIISGLTIPEDVYPFFTYEDNTPTVVFLNATILADANASNMEAKRDNLGRFRWRNGFLYRPISYFKRDTADSIPVKRWSIKGYPKIPLPHSHLPFSARDGVADADAPLN
ncbi:hypothetical protein JCM33374_g5997 [Metschnikowia sp. JCM 33374]|nr:hypothetical protein JCM33374_g5997 [Metschnikowia sp. JCM 33374]